MSSNRHKMNAVVVWLGFVAYLWFPLPCVAQTEQMPVPADSQVPLLLKVLTFDRNFSQKITSALRIAIVYDPSNPESRRAQRDIADILDRFSTKTIKQLPIEYIPLQYRGEQTLDESAKAHNINVFYIAPGNARHLQALLRVSLEHQITTITGVPDYVVQGVAVGIEVRENHKPGIFINLSASKSHGCDFDAKLLQLARIVLN